MKRVTDNLAEKRCSNHASREAAARCPGCGRFFCRECVTDHEGKFLCIACLKKASSSRTSRSMPVIIRVVTACVGIFVAWAVFYAIGQLLILLPDSFHEGTLWGGH
jgi:hypothetical protein